MARQKRYIPTIGEHIKDHLKASGITAYRLAKECNIRHSLMSKILQNKTSLSDGNAMKIARFLFNGADDYLFIRLREDIIIEHMKENEEIKTELEKIKPLELEKI